MLQNISAVQLIILLAIVLLVFGTKRLRNLGSDLGTAIRGFRKGMSEEDEDESKQPEQLSNSADDDSINTKNNTHKTHSG